MPSLRHCEALLLRIFWLVEKHKVWYFILRTTTCAKKNFSVQSLPFMIVIKIQSHFFISCSIKLGYDNQKTDRRFFRNDHKTIFKCNILCIFLILKFKIDKNISGDMNP